MYSNPKSRAAFFENLRKQGRLNPTVPKVKAPHPKELTPVDPSQAEETNPLSIGKTVKPVKFGKLRKLFGV